MDNIRETENELIVIVADKYLKSNIYPVDIYSDSDELFIGAVKYLRDKGKSCEFLGFNESNGHVIVIDGIKYCTHNKADLNIGMFSFAMGKSVYDNGGLSYETFVIVENEQKDYIENFFDNRVNRILDILEDKKSK